MSENEPAAMGKGMYWTGVVMSVLPSLMLLMASAMALSHSDQAVKGFVGQYGYPESAMFGIGLACLVSTILYIIPQTAVLGAILLTGYLGGAVATHVHANEGPMLLAPVIFGALVWGGLFLRDARIRALLPWRK
ncbi:MAG TPA: DoxX family protein [Candidatus Methylacidiphilales bacterium]|nr:DoxX family protein [Candidatus Methylacidiphilales bacterium]